MLHTLQDNILPTIHRWIDRIAQWLGFFSIDIARQANALIESIHDNLSQGWLSREEYTQVRHEQEGWRSTLESIDKRQKPPPLRLLFTLEKRLNRLRINQKIDDAQHHKHCINALNNPDTWSLWESMSNHQDAIDSLKKEWRSFCDVGGISLAQSTSLWHALQSLKSYFQTIETYSTWRFLWLKKTTITAYRVHIRKNLDAIATLETQLQHYLWFSTAPYHASLHVPHPLHQVIQQLHAYGITNLTVPEHLLEMKCRKETMQEALNILGHGRYQQALKRLHKQYNHRLSGILFDHRWYCVPMAICQWLSRLCQTQLATPVKTQIGSCLSEKTNQIHTICKRTIR